MSKVKGLTFVVECPMPADVEKFRQDLKRVKGVTGGDIGDGRVRLEVNSTLRNVAALVNAVQLESPDHVLEPRQSRKRSARQE